MTTSQQRCDAGSEGEFQDPLKDYSPPTYADPLEQGLAEDEVSVLQTQPCETIAANATIREAVERLASIHHACLLVEQDGRLVGMFTDRDLLDRVALEYADIQDNPVSSVMTRDPVSVHDNDSVSAALSVMAVSGYRHVPVLNLEKQLVGIVTPRRVTEYLHRLASST